MRSLMELVNKGMIVFMVLTLGWVMAPTDSEGQQAATGKDKVIISTGIDPTMVLPLIAEKRGLFEKNNIEGKVILAESGAAALDMMLSGNSDAGLTVEIPGVRAASKGAKIAVAARLNISPGYVGIISKKALNQPKDLVGKKVAIVQKASSEYYFNRYLAHFNISPKDVNILHLGPPEMVPALIQNMIDAFVAWEPWLTRAIEHDPQAKVFALASNPNLYDNPVFIYVSESFAGKKDVLVRVIKSVIEAETYLKTDRAGAVKITAEAYKIPESLANQLLDKIIFNVGLHKDTINKYKDIAGWMRDNKMVDTLPDFDKLFRSEFIKIAAPDRTDL